MRNIKEFENHEAYIDFISSTEFVRSNVSYCDDKE